MRMPPRIKQDALIMIMVCVPKCSAAYPINREEMGWSPKDTIVNKPIILARISPGAINCITPSPVVKTSGAPKLMRKIAIIESGRYVERESRR